MGTIADKLTYLDGTKQALKTSINNIGGDITNETTFREYATELDNIYDNIPKTTGESSNLSLNTLKGKMNTTLKGDTQQDTTNGYQLWDLANGSYSNNGVTAVVNNGEITLNGTASGTSFIDITLSNSVTWESGTYTIEANNSVANSNVRIRVVSTGENDTTLSNINTTQTITYNSELSFITNRVSLRVQSGTTLTNYKFKPMLEKGSTAHNYEPYTNGASPNPTYPQNIEVVTGSQEVKVENKNILQFLTNETKTSNGITTTTNNSSITINGTSSGTVTIENKIKPLSLNGTYKLSGYTRNDNYVDLYYKNSGGTIQVVHCKNTPTINFNEGDTLHSIFIYVANGTTATFNNETFNLQLEKGSSASEFTPHQEQTQTISLGNIELSKIGNYQDYLYKTSGKNLNDMSYWTRNTGSGITLINNGDGSINVNGTATGLMVYKLSNAISLKANTTYYITGGYNDNCRIDLRDNNLQTYGSSSTGVNSVGTYTPTTDTTAFLCIRVPSGITISNLKMLPMISTENNIPFEPYGSGIWYKKENIGKIIINGTTNVINSKSGATTNNIMLITTNNLRIFQPASSSSVIPNNLCDHFTIITQQRLQDTNPGEIGALVRTDGTIAFGFGINSEINSVALANTWFQNNNTIFYGQRSTPQDIEITNTTLIEQLNNLQKLKSYNGVTNINCSGNLSAILSVSAIKGE